MLNKYQVIYAGANLLAPSAGVVMVYALGTGTIKNVRVKVKTANGAGSTVFNLSKNGVDQFTTELTIASGQTAISTSGLSIAVVFGDILILKLTSISTGGVIAPVALQFESEELLILSAADLAQMKTDLALVKGDVGLGNVDNTSDATKNAAAVTLTNKTLTAPVINSPTGIVKGDVGLGNVDNTSDATKNSAAVTLTNKTLTTPTIASFVNANHTHQDAAGGGTLAESSLALTDITTNNVSTSKHGFAPKLPNDATKYLDGTGAYTVPAGGGGGGYDGGRPTAPLSNFYFRDDFLGGSYGGTATALWDCFNASGAPVTGVANHPGIMQVGNATINTVASLSFDKWNNNTPQIVCSNASQLFEINWVFKLTGVMSNTNFRCGLAYDNTAIAPAHGIYVEKLAADTTFFGVTRAASTQSRTAAMATAVIGTWYLVRVRRIDATTVGFTVNGGTEVTATANIPTNAINPFIHIYSADANLKQIDVDYFDISITGLTRY